MENYLEPKRVGSRERMGLMGRFCLRQRQSLFKQFLIKGQSEMGCSWKPHRDANSTAKTKLESEGNANWTPLLQLEEASALAFLFFLSKLLLRLSCFSMFSIDLQLLCMDLYEGLL